MKTDEQLIWEAYQFKSKGDAFIYYSAEMLFASSWADYVEEIAKDGEPSRTSGKEIYDIKPDAIPREALEAAMDLLKKIEELNNASIGELYDRAIEAGGTESFQRFSTDLTLQSMGHGVSWFDDNPKFDLKLPDIEFSYLDLGYEVPEEEEKEEEWGDDDIDDADWWKQE